MRRTDKYTLKSITRKLLTPFANQTNTVRERS